MLVLLKYESWKILSNELSIEERLKELSTIGNKFMLSYNGICVANISICISENINFNGNYGTSPWCDDLLNYVN